MVHATPDEIAAVRAFAADLEHALHQLARELHVEIENIPQARPILVALALKVWREGRAHERTFGHRKRAGSGVMETTTGPWPDDEDTAPIGDRKTPVVPTDDTRPGTRRARLKRK